jgi:hypothetical protein
MAGGTIYKKQIIFNNEQGTGDNNLIIAPKNAYQVPFTFKDDWNEISIGVFLSFVSGDTLNSGFNSSNISKDSGGSTNDTFTWIGVTKNAQTKTLPLDAANQGFVGYSANTVFFENSTTYYKNKLVNFNSISASGSSTYGENVLGSAQIKCTSASSVDTGGILCIGLKDDATTYADTEGSGDFCSYFGIKYKVVDKGLSTQTIAMEMSQGGGGQPGINQPTHVFSNPSSAELKDLIDGGSTPNDNNSLDNLSFNDGSSAYDLPDSFFFYNGFSSAPEFQNVRPRIHAWAVKKIS